MCDKVNVLIIVNNLNVGGAQKHAVDLINSLDRERFNVAFISLKHPNVLYDFIDISSVVHFQLLDIQSKLSLRHIRQISRLYNNQNIDIVLCANRFSMVYGIAARFISWKKPRVIEVFHTTLLDGFKEHLLLVFHRLFFRMCDLVVFVSNNQRNYWIKKKKLRVRDSITIQNGIDLAYFNDTPSQEEKKLVLHEAGFDSEDFIVGICAALRKEKHHVDLVDAICLARDKGCRAKLLVIGDGPMRSEIEYHLRRTGLSEHSYITGFQSDVRPYLATCGCVVISSHFVETFSIAALEAMAMEKPMIMTDIGGADEQVRHGVNGFIYQKGDIAALAGHIVRLSDRERQGRMGKAARAVVCSKFTLQIMQHNYEKVLLRISRL